MARVNRAVGASGTSLPWLLVAGIVLIGLILRGPIIAVAPIIDEISSSLGLTAAQAGLLTSLPVLCFAVATPFASLLIGRAGANVSTTIAILGVMLGTIVRSAGGAEAAFAGTIIMGVFITIGNVVVPVLIRRDVSPHRIGMVTGLYTSALNVGSMITSIATAPLAERFGWRGALAVWASLAVVAGVAWFIAIGPRAALRWGPVKPSVETGAIDTVVVSTSPIDVVADARAGRTWTNGTAILLALTFAGQAFSYYGVTAWLPKLLVDQQGYTVAAAGSSSSVFQIAAVIGALGVPLLAQRAGVVAALSTVAALWITIPVGLILLPGGWVVWATLGGAAQGGGITIVFMIVVQLATSGAHARRLSAMVQGLGYALAAIAPSAVGAAHDASGEWTVPLLVVAVGVSTFTVCGITAAVRATRAARAG